MLRYRTSIQVKDAAIPTTLEKTLVASQVAYLAYIKARLTFCPKDMAHAINSLLSAIAQIKNLMLQAKNNSQLLDLFSELQAWNEDLNKALNWLSTINKVITAGNVTCGELENGKLMGAEPL